MKQILGFHLTIKDRNSIKQRRKIHLRVGKTQLGELRNV